MQSVTLLASLNFLLWFLQMTALNFIKNHIYYSNKLCTVELEIWPKASESYKFKTNAVYLYVYI
jgi:hypothetical protein